MSKFTNKQLREALFLSVTKKARTDGNGNAASVVISKSGKTYFGGKAESDTNLLDVTPEQTALLIAVQHRDFQVAEVVTLIDSTKPIISPLALKVMADFANRTSTKIAYSVLDAEGTIVFKTKNVLDAIPFYHPEPSDLVLKKVAPKANWAKFSGHTNDAEIAEALKKYALKGLELAFTTYRGASSYGAAVLTESGKIFYSGQYSSPDKRLMVHAEMGAILAALMAKEEKLTHLAVVSDKFETEPCQTCGPCRQFITELSKRYGWKLKVYCFAKKEPVYNTYSMETLLPNSWSSKKW